MSSGVRLAAAATATAMANSAHQRLGSSLAPAMASSQAGTRVAGGAGQIRAQKRQRVQAGAPMLEAPVTSSRRATVVHATIAAPVAAPEAAPPSSQSRQAGQHAAATATTWLTGSSRAVALQSGGNTLWRQADVAADAEAGTPAEPRKALTEQW